MFDTAATLPRVVPTWPYRRTSRSRVAAIWPDPSLAHTPTWWLFARIMCRRQLEDIFDAPTSLHPLSISFKSIALRTFPQCQRLEMIGRAPSKKLGDGVVEAHKEFIRESATFSAYFKPENEKKNAKQDKVFLYDWNRVILTDGPDYYHASFVDGCARLAQYVMAQAPFSKETQDDFARLVQQTKPDAIFYLDKLDSDEGKFLSTSGKVTVKCDEDRSGDFHNLSFGKVKTKLFVVNSWSVDHDPPKNIVDIHEKMRKVIGWENKGHILFVCKDGVSRSGIMVLLDMESERIRSKGRMKIADTVRHIRYQRSNSFDTFELFDASTVVLTELAKRNLDK